MSNTLIKELLNTKILNFVEDDHTVDTWGERKLKKHPNLYKKVLTQTNFIDDTASFRERMYCIIHNISKPVLCSCGTQKKFDRQRGEYRQYCSSTCFNATQHENLKEKLKKRKTIDTSKPIKVILKQHKIIRDDGSLNPGYIKILNNFDELKQLILDTSKDIDDTLRGKMYCLMNDVIQPTCIMCDTPVKFNQGKGRHLAYCSAVCATASPKVKEKRLQKMQEPKQLLKNEKQIIQTRIGLINMLKQYKILRDDLTISNQGKSLLIRVPELTEKLLENTKFVHDLSDNSYHERIYCLIENILAIPLCSCGQPVNYRWKKYSDHCSDCHYNFIQAHLSTDALEKLHDIVWLQDQNYNKEQSIVAIAEQLGVTPRAVIRHFDKADLQPKRYNFSRGERQVYDFLSLVTEQEILQNDKTTIPPLELDLFIPKKNLAIEFNGIHWHGESTSGRGKQYHINKTNLCRKHGIRLIHVWDSEWFGKQDLVQSRIKNVLGLSNKIYARKCEIKEIPKQQRKTFFNSAHIQGDNNAPISLGLFFENNMVAVMSFGRSRYNTNYQYELIRFACVMNTTVVGGAGKLFKYFVRTYDPQSVISYADLRWNTGGLYEKLGFNFLHRSQPNYFYFKDSSDTTQLHSRHQFQKHKLKDKLDIFDPDLSEWENMKLNGYDRIWDCGNAVFGWTCSSC